MKFPFTKAEFTAWVKTGAYKRKYQPGSCGGCPLGQYLGIKMGASAQMGGHSTWYYNSHSTAQTPKWAERFSRIESDLGAEEAIRVVLK